LCKKEKGLDDEEEGSTEVNKEKEAKGLLYS